jgi:hypothetical protein
MLAKRPPRNRLSGPLAALPDLEAPKALQGRADQRLRTLPLPTIELLTCGSPR